MTAPLLSNFDPVESPPNQSTVTAVVSALFDGVRAPLGATKGGAGLNTKTEWRAAEYDGRRHIVAGTQEVVGFGSTMTATVIDFFERTLAAALPGSTNAGGIITPRAANLAIAKGDYLQLPWYQIPLKNGEHLVWEFDLGLVTEWPIDTKDKDEANMKFTIMAVVDGTRVDYSPNLPDFRHFRIDANGAVIG